jgi:hypothetical protein
MKGKFKLNVAGLKSLGLQHGEKLAMLVGVGALLMFIWSAIKADTLGPDKQPEKLDEVAKKADQHILNSKWDPVAKGIEVVDYVRRAQRDPLKDKDYRLANNMNPPIVDPKQKRPDPKILPVEEIGAAAGTGIFALTREDVDVGEGPVGPPRRKPIQKNPVAPKAAPPLAGPPPKAINPKFPGGKQPKNNPNAPPGPGPMPPRQMAQGDVVPMGVRANASSELKGVSWVVITGLVPVRSQEMEFEESFRNVIKPIPEADSPEYLGLKIERAEVKGDAPLVWHEIKLKDLKKFKARWQAEAHEVINEMFIDPMFMMHLGPLVGANWDPKEVGHPKVPLAERLLPSRTKKPVEEVPEEGDEEDIDPLGGGRPNQPETYGNPLPPGMRMPGGKGKLPGPGGNVGNPTRKADQTLFRFFDFTVEPGRSYCYRVQLKLSNPNYNVTDRYLKDPNSRTQKLVSSPWSQVTPVVTVPRDIELLAGTVKQTSKEPIIKAVVSKLDRERGMKLVAEDTFQRGSVLNIHKKVKLDSVPGTDPVEVETELNSDAVIVDIAGGKPLKNTKSMTEPGEMIVLQPDGTLIVRDELDDELAYRTANPPEAKGSSTPSGEEEKILHGPTGRGGRPPRNTSAPGGTSKRAMPQ